MGQQIGTMGATGNAKGNHLHFGLCKGTKITYTQNDVWVNPLDYLEVYTGQAVGNTTKSLYGNKIKYHQEKSTPKTTTQLNLRQKASSNSKKLALMEQGCEVEILGEENNMYKIRLEGYASKNYIK